LVRPFPTAFVFPNLLFLPFWLFNTGLSEGATALFASGLTCVGEGGQQLLQETADCVAAGPMLALALAVLAAVVAVLAIGLHMLLHFMRCFRADSWEGAEPAKDASKIDDPLFRLLGKIRARLGLRALHRELGGWTTSEEDSVEPRRTERLLANLWTCTHATAADSIAAMEGHLLDSCSGHTTLALLFAWLTMLVQVFVGVMSGVGPYLTAGSRTADAQVATLAGVKISWAILLLSGITESVDSLGTYVAVAQFLSEGIAAAVLLFAQHSDIFNDENIPDELRGLSFFLLLIPVFLPVLQTYYDKGISFIDQAKQLCRKICRGLCFRNVIRPVVSDRHCTLQRATLVSDAHHRLAPKALH